MQKVFTEFDWKIRLTLVHRDKVSECGSDCYQMNEKNTWHEKPNCVSKTELILHTEWTWSFGVWWKAAFINFVFIRKKGINWIEKKSQVIFHGFNAVSYFTLMWYSCSKLDRNSDWPSHWQRSPCSDSLCQPNVVKLIYAHDGEKCFRGNG